MGSARRGGAGDGGVRERHSDALALLVLFVPFASDEHPIVAAGVADGKLNCALSINLTHQSCVSSDTERNLSDDGFGSFISRVVGSQHNPVRGARGNAQQLSLGAVAVSSRA